MNDLSRRLIVGPICITAAVLLLLLAFHPFFQYVVALVVSALSAIAVWEYGQFAKAKGGKAALPILIALTVCQSLSFFVAARGWVIGSFPAIIFFLGFLILFAWYFKERTGAIVDLAVSSFGLLYIAVPMGMLLGILYYSPVDGRWWIAYLLTVTKITDIGAYFAGSLWGRHKLAPAISPNKTVEGAVFGLLCAITASWTFLCASEYMGSFSLGSLEWLILALVLGVVGQFGDLSESLLKRDANKKDSNRLPGLGGVLDAVDSLLFNATIIYVYLYFIKI